jgi:acyl-CoA hydrolase
VTEWQEKYNEKLLSLNESVKLIKSGDHIAFPGTGTVPWGFFGALFSSSHDLENVSCTQNSS